MPVRLPPSRARLATRPCLNRVVKHAEHDGDRRRCTLGRECCGEASDRGDYRNLPANQLGRRFGESLLGPPVVDRYVLALYLAGFYDRLWNASLPQAPRGLGALNCDADPRGTWLARTTFPAKL